MPPGPLVERRRGRTSSERRRDGWGRSRTSDRGRRASGGSVSGAPLVPGVIRASDSREREEIDQHRPGAPVPGHPGFRVEGGQWRTQPARRDQFLPGVDLAPPDIADGTNGLVWNEPAIEPPDHRGDGSDKQRQPPHAPHASALAGFGRVTPARSSAVARPRRWMAVWKAEPSGPGVGTLARRRPRRVSAYEGDAPHSGRNRTANATDLAPCSGGSAASVWAWARLHSSHAGSPFRRWRR